MATQVWPQKIQKVEFDVTTSEGPGRVTIVTGQLQVYLQAASQGSQAVTKESYMALLDPLSAPGKFRKATATASLGWQYTSGQPGELQCAIEDAQATLDDETGQVRLVVDLMIAVTGANSNSIIYAVMFQVSTLALV